MTTEAVDPLRTVSPTGERRRIGVLVAGNLLGGVGVASGIAVGALLVAELGATSLAGLGQALSVLGAAVAAIPLAGLAARRGRRTALATGYAVALLGAALVVTAASARSLLLLLVGLAFFGVAQATNLQSRYAATDGVPARARGRTMAVVIWATTLGSVAGPNLTSLGRRSGEAVGVPGLGGPYLFSGAAFGLAAVVIALAYRARPVQRPEPSGRAAATTRLAPTGAVAALRWASHDAPARLGVTLVATAHATMVMVMVMTPLHMSDDGHSLRLIGLVISLHILGMYALSPVFGTLVDRWGTYRTAALGVGLLALAVSAGFVSAAIGGATGPTALALLLLGLGWSGCTIAGSALVAGVEDDAVRVPLQGAADAAMNYAGAGAAAVSGALLAAGGFRLINVVGALLLVPVVALLLGGRRAGTPQRR